MLMELEIEECKIIDEDEEEFDTFCLDIQKIKMDSEDPRCNKN